MSYIALPLYADACKGQQELLYEEVGTASGLNCRVSHRDVECDDEVRLSREIQCGCRIGCVGDRVDVKVWVCLNRRDCVLSRYPCEGGIL